MRKCKNNLVHSFIWRSHFVKFNFSMERVISVYSEIVSRSIWIWVNLMESFTATTFVTLWILTFRRRVITCMRCHAPIVEIGLHDIHFWTPNASNLVGITIIIISIASSWIPVRISSWCWNKVKCNIAATPGATKVNIEFDLTTKKIWWVKQIWSHLTISRTVSKLPTCIMFESDRRSADLLSIVSVLFSSDSVNNNINCWVTHDLSN